VRSYKTLTSLGVIALWAAAVSGAACGGKSDTEEVSPSSGEIAVRIESHYWSDATISISRGGAWNRIGLAGANKSSSFVVPYRQFGSSQTARLKADPVGGDPTFVSEAVSVRPGVLIVWTLESTLDRSSIATY
jgi:hypothetical protein